MDQHYGTTTAYGASVVDAAQVTAHSLMSTWYAHGPGNSDVWLLADSRASHMSFIHAAHGGSSRAAMPVGVLLQALRSARHGRP